MCIYIYMYVCMIMYAYTYVTTYVVNQILNLSQKPLLGVVFTIPKTVG